MSRTTRLLRTFSFGCLTAIGLGLTAVEDAHALQGGEDPALLPVLVDKRFGNRGVHQVSLQFSTAMATKFFDDTGGVVAYAFNFNDLIGLEVSGVFLKSDESNIMQKIRDATAATMEPQLTDLYKPIWMANLDLVLVPLYGKISFASELDPAYDLFLLGGAGFGGLKRHFQTKDDVSTSAPIFNFGLGLRFYFTRLIALRVEFRDYFYIDPGKNDDPAISGLTHSLNFEAGLQFGFGG